MIHGYLYISKADRWISRFMWVRAQIDYLQRLPSDIEKQRALKKLPPDLPRTYIRIFETIDNVYPAQTTKYIQRLLKWLVLESKDVTRTYGTGLRAALTSDILRQAICIENEAEWPSDAAVPRTEQLLSWLGCLVRKRSNTIALSHFTVKEFLQMNAEDVSSCVARKYLVDSEDDVYVLDIYLTCMIHDKFKDTALTTWGEVQLFLSKYPIFGYVTATLCARVWRSIRSGFDRESESLIHSTGNAWDGFQDGYVTSNDRMQRLLSISHSRPLELWAICHSYLMLVWYKNDIVLGLPAKRCLPSPLHFAAVTGLVVEVQRLLKVDLDPDDAGSLNEAAACPTPLHLAICINNQDGVYNDQDSTVLYVEFPHTYDHNYEDQVILERSLLVIKTLLEAGADIDRQLEVKLQDYEEMTIIVTPLVLAVICGFPEAVSVLLNAGAKWGAGARENLQNEDLQNVLVLCSFERLLEKRPQHESTIQRAIEIGGHQTLKDAIEIWKVNREREYRDSSRTYDNSNDVLSSQELFVEAYQTGSWDTVRELITTRPEININRNDAKGLNAVYCASALTQEASALTFLLEHGAESNLLTSTGLSALNLTIKEGCLNKMSLLLQSGASIEHSYRGGWTPLLIAVFHGRREVLELLLDKGANLNAVFDNGFGVLQLALERHDTEMFSLLLARGADSTLSNNYGSTPLHEACRRGLEVEVEKILETTGKLADLINCDCVDLGTPLYVAARKGFDQILFRLLDSGAEIDKAGRGNPLGSALMVACAEGHENAVRLLLSRGASQEVEGSRFKSAIRTAQAFRQEEVVKILESTAAAQVEEAA